MFSSTNMNDETQKQRLSGTDNSNALPMKFSLKGYPNVNLIVIDGELRLLIDDSPPNTVLLKDTAGILNIRKCEGIE